MLYINIISALRVQVPVPPSNLIRAQALFSTYLSSEARKVLMIGLVPASILGSLFSPILAPPRTSSCVSSKVNPISVLPVILSWMHSIVVQSICRPHSPGGMTPDTTYQNGFNQLQKFIVEAEAAGKIPFIKEHLYFIADPQIVAANVICLPNGTPHIPMQDLSSRIVLVRLRNQSLCRPILPYYQMTS